MTKTKELNSKATHLLQRNEGIPFNTAFFDHININKSAVERRAATLPNRRTVKKEWQAAWLLKAISCMDLTTLAGDDTRGNVTRLCAKARSPVRLDLLEAMGMADINLHTGAVCVYHNLIPFAERNIGKVAGFRLLPVSTGFPAGKISFEEKIREIELSVAAGATEIDIVISRDLVLESKWKALYDEVAACRKACGAAHMKNHFSHR